MYKSRTKLLQLLEKKHLTAKRRTPQVIYHSLQHLCMADNLHFFGLSADKLLVAFYFLPLWHLYVADILYLLFVVIVHCS